MRPDPGGAGFPEGTPTHPVLRQGGKRYKKPDTYYQQRNKAESEYVKKNGKSAGAGVRAGALGSNKQVFPDADESDRRASAKQRERAKAAQAKQQRKQKPQHPKPDAGSGLTGGNKSGRNGGNNKPGKPGKGSNKGSGNKGSGVGSTPPVDPGVPTASDYQSKAESSVDLMLNPKINELLRLQDNIESEYTRQKNDLNTDTAARLSDLSTSYGQLDKTLESLFSNANSAYTNAQTTQNNNYDALTTALQTISSGQQAGVSDELSRLGIAGVDTSKLTGDAQFIADLNQSNKAAAAANLAAQAANQSAFGTNVRSAQQAAGVQAQTQAKASATQMLHDLLFQRNNMVRDAGSKIADVSGQRGALTQQMLDQYEQQAYERMMEDRQQNFLNQMSVNNFNLQSDRFNADQAYRQAQLAQAGLELEQEGLDGGSGSNRNGGLPTGFVGAQQYLQQNVKDPSRLAALTSILQRIDTHKQNVNKPFQDWSQARYSDIGKILNYGYSFLDDPGFERHRGPRTKSLLRQALEAYFGKING